MQAITRQTSKPLETAPRAGAADADVLSFISPSEAIAAAQVPLVARRVIWTVTTMFGAFLLAIGLIHVDRVVTAAGRVVSTAGDIVVQPLDTSIVRSIEVRPGQRVRKGELLARLDPTFAAADASAVQSQVASLGAEVRRLQAELDDKPFEPDGHEPAGLLQAVIYTQRAAERNSKLESFRKKIEALKAAIARSEADAARFSERSEVASSIETMRKTLERQKVGSRLNSLLATDNRLEAERHMSTAVETGAEAKSELAAMVADRDSYLQNWRGQTAETLAEQTQKLDDAKEALNKVLLRRRLIELHADRDAIVQTVAKVSEGSVLQPGQHFLTLVPADAPLEVEANISGGDIGFVRDGDEAAIKFDTFPYTRYGMAHGSVRVISPDSFNAEEQHSGQFASAVPIPQSSTELFYRSRITIERVDLRGVPKDLQVVPGMPVVTDIKVGRQTVLGYLLGRVMSVANEGFREP